MRKAVQGRILRQVLYAVNDSFSQIIFCSRQKDRPYAYTDDPYRRGYYGLFSKALADIAKGLKISDHEHHPHSAR